MIDNILISSSTLFIVNFLAYMKKYCEYCTQITYTIPSYHIPFKNKSNS